MSVYPNELDSDLEIPRVDDEVSEISGDVINALRDAVFNIEKTLGISLQGNKPNLADRISVSIDSNGNIKSSAISSIGLVTLPITDNQISSTASIAESKLDLDYSTQSLKNSINSSITDINALQLSLNSISASFSSHINGLSNKHDGYQININNGTFIGVAGLSATTIGDAINEFSTIFITGDGSRPPHIDLTLPTSIKHTANYISVNTDNFSTIDSTSTTVQEALDSVDNEIVGQQNEHMDNFHSNGILKEINSGEFYNPNQRKIGPVTISYSAGSTVAKLSGVTSFSDLGIVSGDILKIQSGVDDEGTFKIQAVGPKSGTGTIGDFPELTYDEVDVFHVFTTTETSATGSIYKSASISSESAPLACAVRNNNTLVDTISILNPSVARVVSIGFNGTILNADGYEINIEVGLGNGQVRGLTIPNLYYERLGSAPPSVVDSCTVAERINAYVSHPDYGHHFPISAFKVGNEIAIAHNLVGADYTLKILDGYTGNRALGLDAYGSDVLDLEIVGNDNSLFNVNGVSRSTLRTIVDGYATITADSETFTIYNNDGSIVNPVNLGIGSGSVIHITGHPTLDVNGSYTLYSSNTTSISVFTAEKIPVVGISTTFNVLITDSHVSLHSLFSAETDLGLVEIFVDEDGRSLVNQRLSYDNSIGSEVHIIGVSDGFPPSSITLNQGTVSGTNYRTFSIISDSVSGTTVTLHKDFIGTFKLYHPDNINYLTIKVNSELSSVYSETVVVDDTLNLDETMRLSVLHFDSQDSITNVLDTRPFGNLSANQISDDFIELFSQRPISDLRSDGVVRGFDVLAIPYVDSLTGMQALPLSGGVVYVNGVRVVVETQKVLLQSYDSDGNINSNIERIIGINDFGTIREFDDELGEILSDGYNSSVSFGKILPLYKVTLDADGLIDDIIDLRLFINNLDEKIELIVDETNNVVGNFRSLSGALLYADSYPSSEKLTIKIVGTVTADRPFIVPNGVSITGISQYGGGIQKITNNLDLNDHLLTLSGNNRLENIEVSSSTIGMDGYLVSVDGSNVNIENCRLRFTEDVALGSFTSGSDHGIGFGEGAVSDVRIHNNKIDNVFAGIVSAIGCDNLTISDNILTNIVGFGIETYGVFIGSTRAVSNTVISGNTIEVPSIAFSDIMGIKVEVFDEIGTVRIDNNNISHDGGDTMTSGIHIENTVGNSNKISELFITDNFIRGIQLDANSIFGIYVNDVSRAIIANNILRNIGSTAGDDTAFIKLDSNVSMSNVHGNILEDGSVLSGVDVGTSTNASIVGNILSNIGDTATGILSTSTVFIRGNSIGAKVSDNVLIAASTETSAYGIHWSAAGHSTSISNNVLKASSDAGTPASFRDYAIRVLGANMDIHNNTITQMASATNSIGISSGPGSNYSRITNNTISGADMEALIELTGGTEHMVSGNMLKNSSNDSSIFIRINSTTDSLVSGNTMRGVADYGITEESTTIDGCVISNNNIQATISVDALDVATSSDCTILGNFVLDTASTSFGSSNLIGVNRGVSDVVGISIVNGIPNPDGSTHWDFSDSNKRWYYASSGAIYFPLDGVPNGSRIVSVQINGVRSSGTYSINVYKKLIASPYTVSSIGSGTVAAGTDFTEVVSTSSDVIDYSTYTYLVRINCSGGSVGNDRIHGVFANIRY